MLAEVELEGGQAREELRLAATLLGKSGGAWRRRNRVAANEYIASRYTIIESLVILDHFMINHRLRMHLEMMCRTAASAAGATPASGTQWSVTSLGRFPHFPAASGELEPASRPAHPRQSGRLSEPHRGARAPRLRDRRKLAHALACGRDRGLSGSGQRQPLRRAPGRARRRRWSWAPRPRCRRRRRDLISAPQRWFCRCRRWHRVSVCIASLLLAAAIVLLVVAVAVAGKLVAGFGKMW